MFLFRTARSEGTKSRAQLIAGLIRHCLPSFARSAKLHAEQRRAAGSMAEVFELSKKFSHRIRARAADCRRDGRSSFRLQKAARHFRHEFDDYRHEWSPHDADLLARRLYRVMASIVRSRGSDYLTIMRRAFSPCARRAPARSAKCLHHARSIIAMAGGAAY